MNIDPRKQVSSYLQSDFNVNEIKIEEFPYFPGGVIISLPTGEKKLIYLDLLTESIVCTTPVRMDSTIRSHSDKM